MFDNITDTGVLYKWLEEECARRGVFADSRVRPLTVITPEDYEGLLALGARGDGICRLLMEKTELFKRWGPLDQFLFERVDDSIELRLRTMPVRFQGLVNRSVERLQQLRERKPSHHEIAEGAYYRWLARGSRHGSDVDDWLVAEDQLRNRQVVGEAP